MNLNVADQAFFYQRNLGIKKNLLRVAFSSPKTQMLFSTNVKALCKKKGSESNQIFLKSTIRVSISQDIGLKSCQQEEHTFLFQGIN